MSAVPKHICPPWDCRDCCSPLCCIPSSCIPPCPGQAGMCEIGNFPHPSFCSAPGFCHGKPPGIPLFLQQGSSSDCCPRIWEWEPREGVGTAKPLPSLQPHPWRAPGRQISQLQQREMELRAPGTGTRAGALLSCCQQDLSAPEPPNLLLLPCSTHPGATSATLQRDPSIPRVLG